MDRILDGALLVFVVGVAFYAGALTQRVASLEEWRRDMQHELGAIHAGIRRLERLIADGDVT